MGLLGFSVALLAANGLNLLADLIPLAKYLVEVLDRDMLVFLAEKVVDSDLFLPIRGVPNPDCFAPSVGAVSIREIEDQIARPILDRFGVFHRGFPVVPVHALKVRLDALLRPELRVDLPALLTPNLIAPVLGLLLGIPIPGL
jgi:hypothetical protein